jgi:hypothetical protein
MVAVGVTPASSRQGGRPPGRRRYLSILIDLEEAEGDAAVAEERYS